MIDHLGPVYKEGGEGNPSARITLALAHFFFFYARYLQAGKGLPWR